MAILTTEGRYIYDAAAEKDDVFFSGPSERHSIPTQVIPFLLSSGEHGYRD